MSMVVRFLDQVNERALALSGTSMQGGRSEPEKIPSPERPPGPRTRKSQVHTRLQYSLLIRSFGRIIVQPIASVGEIRLARGDQNGRHAPCRTPHSDAVSAAAIGSSSQTIRQMRVSSLAPTAVLG